jgi:hypothetical protein
MATILCNMESEGDKASERIVVDARPNGDMAPFPSGDGETGRCLTRHRGLRVLISAQPGAVPWSAVEQMKMAWGLAQRTEPPALAARRRGVPPHLDVLVLRSLAWNANERPTAHELAATLDRMADNLDDAPAGMQAPSEVEKTELTPSALVAAEVR